MIWLSKTCIYLLLQNNKLDHRTDATKEVCRNLAILLCRMRMVAGDYILRATAQCFVQSSATSACVFLEKDLMVV